MHLSRGAAQELVERLGFDLHAFIALVNTYPHMVFREHLARAKDIIMPDRGLIYLDIKTLCQKRMYLALESAYSMYGESSAMLYLVIAASAKYGNLNIFKWADRGSSMAIPHFLDEIVKIAWRHRQYEIVSSLCDRSPYYLDPLTEEIISARNEAEFSLLLSNIDAKHPLIHAHPLEFCLRTDWVRGAELILQMGSLMKHSTTSIFHSKMNKVSENMTRLFIRYDALQTQELYYLSDYFLDRDNLACAMACLAATSDVESIWNPIGPYTKFRRALFK
jgi:hypothetical protein